MGRKFTVGVRVISDKIIIPTKIKKSCLEMCTKSKVIVFCSKYTNTITINIAAILCKIMAKLWKVPTRFVRKARKIRNKVPRIKVS
jgi:hypothetical protein